MLFYDNLNCRLLYNHDILSVHFEYFSLIFTSLLNKCCCDSYKSSGIGLYTSVINTVMCESLFISKTVVACFQLLFVLFKEQSTTGVRVVYSGCLQLLELLEISWDF